MNETPPRQPQSVIPASWRAKVAGTLINPDTLLATDYMNHFNEVVMLIEMLPDMPDMLPDCAAWQSKTYAEHFLNSGLDYGPLAAEAFAHLPSSIKVPFDLTVAQLNAVIGLTVKRAAASIAIGDAEEMRRSVGAGIAVMRKLVETLAGIINGSKQTMDQDEIDAMLGAANDDTSAPAPAAGGGAQADIDKLFG
jgi:hypothetical protein